MFFQHLVPFDVRMTQQNSQFPIDEPHVDWKICRAIDLQFGCCCSTIDHAFKSTIWVSGFTQVGMKSSFVEKKTLCIKAFGVTSLGINNDQGWKHESLSDSWWLATIVAMWKRMEVGLSKDTNTFVEARPTEGSWERATACPELIATWSVSFLLLVDQVGLAV